MLNFNKEYFKLEKDRQLYSTKFPDLMTSCEVYGKKMLENTQTTAFTYLISKDHYSYNAGNIDFTSYPNGVWNDFTDIKIVKSEPYFDLDFIFSSTGDITPDNLNEVFKKIKDAMLSIEKNIVETQIFMDSGIPGQLGLPLLPKGCVWYRETDTGEIVALPISDMYDNFQELLNELKKNLSDYKDILSQELRTKTDSLLGELTTLQTQITTAITQLGEQYITDIGVDGNKQVGRVQTEGTTQVQNVANEGDKQVQRLQSIVENITEQQYRTVLNANTNTITIPPSFAPSDKTKVYIDGLLLSPTKDYTLVGDTITLVQSYEYDVDVFINDTLSGKTKSADITSVEVTVDNNVGVPSATGTVENGVLKLDFKNLKGNGIASITFKETTSQGNVYTVLLADGSTSEIIAPKGQNGADGQNGKDGENGVGIQSIDFKETTEDGNIYTITLTNQNTYDFTVPKGEAGPAGQSPFVEEEGIYKLKSPNWEIWVD